MLPKQVTSFAQLSGEGLSKEKILSLSCSLRLFPTPFKGIYYVPSEEERKGRFVERPLRVISSALPFFLGTKEFYFSCRTAEEHFGIVWQPTGELHVVNAVKSGRIKLAERAASKLSSGTHRARNISRILSYYGNEIIFHRGSVKGAKYKETPYGKYALRSQIKKDRKRFRCHKFIPVESFAERYGLKK